MLLTKVKLLNFRNLEKIELDFSPQINIFLGRNGQGKTNLLEGLSYLALGRSHRGARDRELIRFDADHFHISVEAIDGRGDSYRLEAALDREGQKRIRIDGQLLTRNADLVGRLSTVQFHPDEVELAKGGPEQRRRFLDYTLSVSSADTLRHLLAYRRVVAQKNRLLKQRHFFDASELDAFDNELIRHGGPVLMARREMLPTLQDLTRQAYASLAPEGGRIDLSIRSTVDLRLAESAEEDEERDESTQCLQAFLLALQEARPRERALGHALIGPHRDSLSLKLRGRPIRRYGSQGEMRSAAIALKLAQAELLYQRTEERPVVFLDDIFSELDRGRTQALQQRLHQEHQLFIATARLEHVRAMQDFADLRVWYLEDGTVTPVSNFSEIEAELKVEDGARG